jgi:hypothetical protein
VFVFGPTPLVERIPARIARYTFLNTIQAVRARARFFQFVSYMQMLVIRR